MADDSERAAKQARHNEKRKLCRSSKRFIIDILTADTDDSNRFEDIKKRWYAVKESLQVTRKSSTTQNADVLEALLQAYKAIICNEEAISHEDTTQNERQIHTPATPEDEMFICTSSAMRSLLEFLGKNRCGSCFRCSNPWNLDKGIYKRIGHAASYMVKCSSGHSLKWLSSPIVNGKYYVNCRYCIL